MLELTKESVTVAAPGKGECEVCDGKLNEMPSVRIRYKILFKSFEKRACIPCVKEIVTLGELRIAQAERGEFSK